ncbi:MAG: thioredoxin domain-containing protein [Ignavibacteria bacterium]|jgi:uncharacterized protein YyaL (SSP411 family)
MNNSSIKPNKLINEKSPYLLQHAYNPVNWFPWTEEAFNLARELDKPMFLSIGYSTCHWCHVMESESFEDSVVAGLMNETFISIKVDREERPDIDNIYMTVCQILTGHGGWPLTIIMTPDKKPFYAGTYFPKESGHNRTGMLDLIKGIDHAWKNKREEVFKSADDIAGHLITYSVKNSPGEISNSIFQKAFNNLIDSYDEVYGGFGDKPKFPTPHNLMFLLRYWKRTNDDRALEIVENTLTRMRLGGIYDHIGLGFHRYSTDREWLLPHFEKMLYDQAMLLNAYTEAFQATKNKFYKNTAEEIIEYLLRDMLSNEGGFYSAEDADSEGEEGKFYLWSKDELKNLLNEDDFNLVSSIYNISNNGNFYDEATRNKTGNNILFLNKPISELANNLKLPKNELYNKINRIRNILFNEREKRIHPLKDDKILTDWNGLLIASLSKAGRTFNKKEYIIAAEKAVAFIYQNMIDENNKLLHRYRKGTAGITATADDYAFLIYGLLELYESTFNFEYFEKAITQQDTFINDFYDEKNGAFFLTSKKSEELIVRQKNFYDSAIPSSNSVALYNLIKLERITTNKLYKEIIEKTISYTAEEINNNPSAFSFLLCGLDYLLNSSHEVVIKGNKENISPRIKDILNQNFIPNKVVIQIDEHTNLFNEIAGFTKDMITDKGEATVYACSNNACNLPINKTADLKKLLKIE